MPSDDSRPTSRGRERIRPWVRLTAALHVCLLAGLAGCSHGHPQKREIEDSAIAMSDRELPDWIVEEPEEVCPSRHTCVVGRVDGAPDREQALDAARAGAYRRLAEIAYPVEVASDLRIASRYQSGEGTDTAVSERTRSSVSGRLDEAEVLETVWVRRRDYDVDGSREVYDAWALTAMQTAKLETLYEREKQRSRETIAELRDRVATVRERLADAPGVDDLRTGLDTFRRVVDELPNLQPVDGLQKLENANEALGDELASAVRTDLEASSWNLDDREATLRVGATLGDTAVSGLAYRAHSPCFDDSRTLEATDSGGETRTSLAFESYLQTCDVEIHPKGLERAKVREGVGPPASCGRIAPAVSVRGFEAGFLQAELADAARAIVDRHLDDDLPSCGGSADAQRPLELRAVVELEVGEPRRVSGRDIWRGGGPVEVRLTAAMADSETELASASTTLTGFGKERDQRRAGLLESAATLLEETFAPAVQNL